MTNVLGNVYHVPECHYFLQLGVTCKVYCNVDCLYPAKYTKMATPSSSDDEHIPDLVPVNVRHVPVTIITGD